MSTVKSAKPIARTKAAKNLAKAVAAEPLPQPEPIVEEPAETTEETEEQVEEDEEIVINKGRKKKYANEEERKIARRIQQREYRIRKAKELEKLRKLYYKDQKAGKIQEVVEETNAITTEE